MEIRKLRDNLSGSFFAIVHLASHFTPHIISHKIVFQNLRFFNLQLALYFIQHLRLLSSEQPLGTHNIKCKL